MHYTLVVILSLLQLLKVCGEPLVVYKTSNIECIPNPKRVENVTCFVKARNWNKAVAQMDCDLILPLRNTSIQIEVFKKSYNNQYYPFLVNIMVNMCDIISKRNFSSYGVLFWKIIKDFTNANHSCPFTGHIMARDIYIDERYFPVFPLGFYLTSFKITENFANRPGESVGTIKFYAQAMEAVKTRQKNSSNTSTSRMPNKKNY